MVRADPTPYVGSRIPRAEDPRLLTGQGLFVADVRLPGVVEATFVRSPHPHAEIVSIDADAARKLPGVIAILTARDLPTGMNPVTEPISKDASDPDIAAAIHLRMQSFHMPLLAESKVLRQGQPVAVVVATDRYLAEDASAEIDVQYKVLPPVMDMDRALSPDAPVLNPGEADNVYAEFHVGEGDVDGAFAAADESLSVRLRIGRVVGAPIECRGTAATFDPDSGSLKAWSTHQRPHFYRRFLSNILDIPEERIRAITPDMGGSFGGGMYPEEFLVPFLAIHLGRPVRWIEDRRENLENARHARDQIHHVDIAFDRDGTIKAMRDDFLVDYGAFNPFGIAVPSNTMSHLRTQYKITACHFRARGIYTNKTPNTVLRGAGRPEGAFVIERVMDLVARKLGMDPIDVRRKNLIPTEEMPFEFGIPYSYGYPLILDTGNYPEQLELALETLDLGATRALQAAARAEGRRIGIGIGSYIEGSGFGPPEFARASLEPPGKITISSGSAPHGQSHETTLAQVAADALGLDIGFVTVRAGDTGVVAAGGGTFASRSAVLAGSATHLAASQLKDALTDAAADALGCSPSDVAVSRAGIFSGPNGSSMTIGDLSRSGTFEQDAKFFTKRVTFSSGTHAAVVEVDELTGVVKVLRYVVAHDCGRMLNPTVVEGQISGGVVHGIGTALYEEIVYADDGTLATPTLFTYLMPTATEVPAVEIVHQEYLSETNPIGAKGCGEGGAVGSPGAIANAVEDALSDLGVTVTEIPLTPERVLSLISAARGLS
jgi:aerobic carbon-monoxide dehydrogenase large subunit